MAHHGFGHLWKQEDMSDVEIVLCYAEDNAPAGDESPEALSSKHIVLQQFPGHSQIMSFSPYFRAQVSVKNRRQFP